MAPLRDRCLHGDIPILPVASVQRLNVTNSGEEGLRPGEWDVKPRRLGVEHRGASCGWGPRRHHRGHGDSDDRHSHVPRREIGILLIVVVPQPPKTVEKRSMLSDTFYGFRFIAEKRGLLGLQLNFFATNLLLGVGFTLLTPMLMLRTGNDTVITGTVQSAFGIGGVVGGIALSAWGGPKRKIDGVFLGMAASALLGMTIMGIAQTPFLLMVGAFLTMLFIPTSNGSNQAIWQAKVPPEVQGRVFATRALIATMSSPIGMVIAGPLADKVMTPAMEPGGCPLQRLRLARRDGAWRRHRAPVRPAQAYSAQP